MDPTTATLLGLLVLVLCIIFLACVIYFLLRRRQRVRETYMKNPRQRVGASRVPGGWRQRDRGFLSSGTMDSYGRRIFRSLTSVNQHIFNTFRSFGESWSDGVTLESGMWTPSPSSSSHHHHHQQTGSPSNLTQMVVLSPEGGVAQNEEEEEAALKGSKQSLFLSSVPMGMKYEMKTHSKDEASEQGTFVSVPRGVRYDMESSLKEESAGREVTSVFVGENGREIKGVTLHDSTTNTTFHSSLEITGLHPASIVRRVKGDSIFTSSDPNLFYSRGEGEGFTTTYINNSSSWGMKTTNTNMEVTDNNTNNKNENHRSCPTNIMEVNNSTYPVSDYILEDTPTMFSVDYLPSLDHHHHDNTDASSPIRSRSNNNSSSSRREMETLYTTPEDMRNAAIITSSRVDFFDPTPYTTRQEEEEGGVMQTFSVPRLYPFHSTSSISVIITSRFLSLSRLLAHSLANFFTSIPEVTVLSNARSLPNVAEDQEGVVGRARRTASVWASGELQHHALWSTSIENPSTGVLTSTRVESSNMYLV
ncbi:hypothetical protein Pcinc_042796 [Petrolisthes cinctipes]|uniref:Uncharacterized protein n=1 Tax=Petrolisthes cinctipes TaxID=88211 RepID=A0AAE1BJX8_PETCI|nr:hypothetical protein Pcinc_042796 [Petrolisthes cinctipes]